MRQRYRHKIRIQKNTPTQDAVGQPIESWSTYLVAYANVMDVNGSEQGTSPIEGVVITQAEMHYPHLGRIPQPTDRFVVDEGDVARTINIATVNRLDGKRRHLQLIGNEVQSG